ncbi:conserved hypothetical protein [Stenotrophomonas maltophilia]|nr:conserved hypothetical protein [Stenotrophomonas maltophilia]
MPRATRRYMAWWPAWAPWRSAWCCSSGEGFPANGLSPLAAGTFRSIERSRAGPACRGRREPVHGGLSAASMPQTPLQAGPARAPSFFRARQPRDEKIEERSARCARESSTTRVYKGCVRVWAYAADVRVRLVASRAPQVRRGRRGAGV